MQGLPFCFACGSLRCCATMQPMLRSTSCCLAALASALLLPTLPLLPMRAAQAQDKPVYRCPGPPVLYTDALGAQEARDRGCRTIEGALITIVQSPKPRATTTAAAAASRPGDSRVDPAAQKARDSDARRILADELDRKSTRLNSSHG